MERAADPAAGNSADPVDMNGLEALQWNWGEAYEIEVNGSEWRARRLDGLGEWMTALSAHDLRNLIFHDYINKPVRRPPAEP